MLFCVLLILFLLESVLVMSHTWWGAVTDRGRHFVIRPDHAIHLQSHANQCYLHTSLGAIERRVGTFTGAAW